MRTFTLLVLSCFCCLSSLHAQMVIGLRTAPLVRTPSYNITGDAILEEFDNGTITLRLSSNFATPSGPDVRIFLSNSRTISGAVQIADLSALNHFSGARTFNVPTGVTLDQYNFVVFYCLQFNQLWASGELGASSNPNAFMCESSSVSSENNLTVSICPTDDLPDIVTLSNSLGEPAGDHFAYLITDENQIVQQVITTDTYDFEGTDMTTQRVYGMHYDGTLMPAIGSNRTATTASACFKHSSSTTFLQVTKGNCTPAFECLATLTATTDWVTEVDICPTDGEDDLIILKNNLGETPGDHYAYLITDTNQIVQAVVMDTVYNFEGTDTLTQRVYGVSYDSDLMVQIGQIRTATTATGCITHSSSDTYLSITKNACFKCEESLTATHAWVTEVDICANDGDDDFVFLQNNINTAPGEHYVFLLTDVNEVLQEVIMDTTYNFEGTGDAEQRVYGLSYAGQLDIKIGENRKNTTASECFTHSGDNLFIRINKTATCAPTALKDEALGTLISFYPNPTSSTLSVQKPNNFVPTQVIITNVLGVTVLNKTLSPTQAIQLDLSTFTAGNYIIKLLDQERFVTRMVQVVK